MHKRVNHNKIEELHFKKEQKTQKIYLRNNGKKITNI